MSDQNVFSENNNVNQVDQPASKESLFADKLAEIKNENGEQKYDSVVKALDGLANAQKFIPQLKTELTQKDQEILTLKAQLEKVQSVEDVVSRLLPNSEGSQVKPEVSVNQPNVSGLDEQAVTNLIKSYLSSENETKTKLDNINKVESALIANYGEKAAEVIRNKASEIGTTPKELESLASTYPDMVLKLFEVKAQQTKLSTTPSVHIPPYTNNQPTLERPNKSLLAGATSREQKDYFAKVRASVHQRLGVTTN